eukprot:TRINITY_DN1081_c0_g1_i1.p1 TRINITY_DN1081_c0_g1~~TRINITY_DN1081_c0_g1_i1.p1  ORF type:complete len:326 (+),score=39.40 TRINITY_DN1081_c0_g1_i1:244-1221(+)
MFRQRWRRGRGGGGNYWVWIMALQSAAQFLQLNHRPPVTLGLIAANLAIYFRPFDLDVLLPATERVCLWPRLILRDKDLVRLMMSAWYHADDTHIVYNMISLLWKGAQIEATQGSERFGVMVGALLILSNTIHVGLAWMLGGSFLDECSIGFSAILFAMKTVLSWNSSSSDLIYGIPIPTRYAAWAELILIQLVVPQASFLGHLSGILAGLAFLHGHRLLPWLSTSTPSFRPRTQQGAQPSWGPRVWGSGRTGGGSQGGSASGMAPRWSCQACTYVNEGDMQACEMCNTPCGAPPAHASAPSAPPLPQDLSPEEIRRARMARFAR